VSQAPAKAAQDAKDAQDRQAHRALMRWLWRDYLRGHRGTLIVAVLLMAVEGAMLGMLSYMIQPMFDDVFVAGDRSAIGWVALAVFAIFLVRAVAGFFNRVLIKAVGHKVSAQMQADLVRHMLGLDSAWFQDNAPGTLIERVRGDTLAAATIWSVVFQALGRDLVALASLLAVAVSIDWVWTLIAVAGAPILLGPIVLLQRWVRRTTRSARAAAARIATHLDEAFHGIDTIKLNAVETRETDRIRAAVDGFVTEQIRSETGQAGIPAMMDIVAGLGFLGVLSYGGLQIIEGQKTVGEFMSFFTAMALIFEPLRRLGNVTGAWQAALASLERLHHVFQARPTIRAPARPKTLPVAPDRADLALEDVTFAYGDLPVLRGASLTARAGETTALVGASGAGKSTVFRMLTRLADPQAGRVTVGGIDVSALALDELRGLFSVVTQDAQLFDETLRDNVVFGRAGASAAEIDAALAAAHVTDFLPKLGAGMDSLAGPRGSALSGGQRQRVAIARALLRDAPILLLDEATSSLDAQSEAVVQAALDRLSSGRTTLVIAHRLATIRQADRILVMDQGRVVDQGTHDDLIARGGLYADLCRLQFGAG